MSNKNVIDAIILSTTYKEDILDIIEFLKSICDQCESIKNDYIVHPVLVFEKSENFKFMKVKKFFKDRYNLINPIILKNNNGVGFSSSLNYGIIKTNSKWILRIDTDDKLKDSRILNQLNLMKKGNLDMSSGYMEDQNGNILKYPKDKIGLILNIALGINPIAHPSVCFKRSSLTSLYNTKLSRCEDFELWIHMFLKRDFRWECIDYPITTYNNERSKIKNKENGKMQIQIRLKYGFQFFLIGIILLLGIVPNLLRLCIDNNFLLSIRRKLK